MSSAPVFGEVPAPTDAALQAVLHKISIRPMRPPTSRGVPVEKRGDLSGGLQRRFGRGPRDITLRAARDSERVIRYCAQAPVSAGEIPLKSVSRLHVALLGCAFILGQWVPSFASAQSLQTQTAALKQIKTFADELCTTVGTSGKAVEWKASAGAAAGLKGLAKFLAELGFNISAGVDSKTTEGVLQSDLARLLEAKGTCELRVFLELRSVMLGPPTPPAPLPKPSPPPAAAPTPHPVSVSKTYDLSAFGLPALWMGMSTQEFSKNMPGNMSLKHVQDWTGITSGSYQGVIERASLGQYVDGRYTAAFGDGKPTANILSKFSYRLGAVYAFSLMQDSQAQETNHPEINCADSGFESVMVMMVSAYGQANLREKEPGSSNHAAVLQSLTRFGEANPCKTASVCQFNDDASLNFREIARWKLSPTLYVEVFRHHMGVNLTANGSPVELSLDCEIEVSIENRR